MTLSFRNKILVTLIVSCTVCTVAAVFVSTKKLTAASENDLVQKSSAILSRIEVGAHYVAEMKTLDGILKETVIQFPDGNLPESQKQKILRSVPIYAAFQIGKIGAAEEHYTFRIASDAPRKKENQATPTELEVIRKFKSDPLLKENVEKSADGKFILVSRPVRIMQDRNCLSCHGDPATSPWHNGNDILGYKMENMKDGDLRATFTIISSLEPVQASVSASSKEILIWGSIVTCFAMFMAFILLRKPIEHLNSLAAELSEVADEVASMSTQIATTSVELSSGAAEQAAALQETSAAMEQMSAMVTRNSENAESSQQVSIESEKSAENGKLVVQSMILSIEKIDESNMQISQQIDKSNQQMTEIVRVINDIGRKTNVINEIVFQTKLLSFNASVEAARAGDAGKGFSVVAEEIGNLAKMSGTASSEIAQMLSDSVTKVELILKNTKDEIALLTSAGQEKVVAGTKIAAQCNEVLAGIVHSTQSVNQMVLQIAAGSAEQSKGVQEINVAITQLNSVTQQNSSASQAASTAAEKLSSQSNMLRDSIRSLSDTLKGTQQTDSAGASNEDSASQSGSPLILMNSKKLTKSKNFKKIA